MKPSQIFNVMNLARRARQLDQVFNPLFVGPPGVGKSQIVQAWANQNNLPFIDLRIALMEAPDFIGFPSIEVKNERQITVHNIPEFFPHDGEGVFLLEEPNRGTSSVMNCLMQLLTDRKIHKYTLPKGWIIVGCINPDGNEYDVNSMDAALKDRFEMFNVSYDKHSFMEYMKSADWHKDVINFVDAGLWTYKAPEEVGNTPGAKYISPRTLSKLNAILLSGESASVNEDIKFKENEMMLLETVLGSNIAKDFYNFRYNESPVMMSDLTKNLKSALKKLEKFSQADNYKSGMISLTVKDIIEDGSINDDMLAAVAKVIPVEQGTVLIRELEFKRKDDTLLGRLCASNKDLKQLFKSVLKYGK